MFTERWPLGLVTLGLAVLAWTSIDGGGPQQVDPLFWFVAASITAIISLVNWTRNTSTTRSLAVSSLIIFGIVRSVDYAFDDLWTPAGAWLVVIGLALQLVRAVRRNQQIMHHRTRGRV